MRIAVFLNGQWRGSSFECSKYLKDYFKHFDVDYYIHTTNYYFGKNIQLDFSQNENHFPFVELSTVYHTRRDIQQIKNTYQNVVYFNVDSKQKNEEITNLKQNFSAFYNIYGGYMCNQYRKEYERINGFEYDVIIKLRPDIIIQKNKLEDFTKAIHFASENPNFFKSEHGIPPLDRITPKTDYPTDIFQIGKNFFDVLDNWVISTLDGNETYLSDLVIKLDYNIFYKEVPGFKLYIIRELYRYGNLLEKFYEDSENYDSLKPGYTSCDLDEILYMNNNTRNDKKQFFKNWNINFEKILENCEKQNKNINILEYKGLERLAYEINKNWRELPQPNYI